MNYVELTQEWRSYRSLHEDTAVLFEQIIALTKSPVVLVAVARGGWLPTRVLGAHFEEAGLDHLTLSISSNYVDLGKPSEHARIHQGLDDLALDALISRTRNGDQVWAIDGPYAMGGAAGAARKYLEETLRSNRVDPTLVRVGVLHWVVFEKSSQAPWRASAATPPDAYARKISASEKPYVDYPWEHPEYVD